MMNTHNHSTGNKNTKNLYSISEVARKIVVNEQTVLLMCENGHFEGAYRIENGEWKIPEDNFITTRKQDILAEKALKIIDKKNTNTDPLDEFDI